LTLALRNDPMLDPDVVAAAGVGPARDVARGENPGRIRLEILIRL
jgi:hypothetical protein